MRSVCYDGDLNASCVLTALCDGTCPSDRQNCSPAPGPGRCLLPAVSRGPDSDSDRALGSDSPVAAPGALGSRSGGRQLCVTPGWQLSGLETG